MPRLRNDLPPDLQAAWEEIEGYARDYGLDFYPIIYQVLDYRTLYEVAALGGFPTRYPHWRFGMEFDQLIKGHTYGLSVIYEMVINNNPVYAYLLEGNTTVDQKTVMAHVCGHADFFKHNLWFAHTNRKMLDNMANHASRIQRIVDRYGYEPVEDFIDTCLSLENLIDYHAPYIRRADAETIVRVTDEEVVQVVEGLPVDRSYMKEFINPPEFIQEQRDRLEEDRQRARHFPEHPQKDILLFLMNYAPIERWQHTVLEIIRDEAYYFAPQGMTKVTNEGWACTSHKTLLFTDKGITTIRDIVDNKLAISVADGEGQQRIYDHAMFQDYETIWIKTKRGLELEGSFNHRLMLPNGEWRRLDELNVGDRLKISGGQNLWAQDYVQLDWTPTRRPVLEEHEIPQPLEEISIGGISLDRSVLHATKSITTASAWGTLAPTLEKNHLRRRPIRAPKVLDENLGALLGYLSGDGHISEVKRTIGLTTGDQEQSDTFIWLVEEIFNLQPNKRWDDGRWRISFSSQDVIDLLKLLGLKTGVAAKIKTVPDVILRSPKPVVAAFLRALYDCDGYAGDAGVILSTSSDEMSEVVQLLLLNFGILTSRRKGQDGCWQVHAQSESAAIFAEEIGFGLARKQEKLRQYVEERQWFKRQEWSDEIVAMERRRADVYDISVEQTHRYAAQGFINHNSYWHAMIMTRKAARASEIVDFADHHAGVVAVHPGRLNPYKLGLELLRNVEERWDKGQFGKEWEDCDDIKAKLSWDKQAGLGRQKLFEVRRFHNDVTFLDEYLTPEFCLQQKLFTFRYNRDTDLYEIASREFQEIKRKLLFRMTNFGQPFIYVTDGNHNNRGELYLTHRHESVDLKMDYARDTMRNIYKIWTRPVHLETVLDDKKRLLSFDGSDYSERRID